ncbi:MAG TPA: glycosyltransferase [Candidatus Krumholzibacterium sp.]|nr:glycosyltransferase [Candidatus Krumholzibacterium sp.]
MRIAFIGDGSLGHVRRWAGYFHERGHEVLLISFEDIEGCRFPAVRLRRKLPTKLLGYIAGLPAIKSRLERFSPDIVNALYVSGYGFTAALCGYRPLVVSALGSDMLVDYPSSPVHRMQIRRALLSADLITTDADNLTEAVVAAGADRERVLKVFFGIEESIFHPPSAVRAGPAGRRIRVISTRNLYEIYNLRLLTDAAAMLPADADVSFTICGDGPLRRPLEERVRRAGMEGRFEFTGKLAPEAVAEKLRGSDIYVSTSLSDSTSVSLLEAMACGDIPVVTDIPANREWIEDGVNGYLVDTGSPEGLSSRILEFAAGRMPVTRIIEANHRLIMEKGLWETNMGRLETAFSRLPGL